jgi:hypothetical protein
MARLRMRRFRRYWLEIAWALFSAANIAVILVWGQWNTVPFHFIWVSLTLVYGVRVWTWRATWVLLMVVTIVTDAPQPLGAVDLRAEASGRLRSSVGSHAGGGGLRSHSTSTRQRRRRSRAGQPSTSLATDRLPAMSDGVAGG